MEYKGINHLIVVDYYFKWIKVKRMINKTAPDLLKLIVAVHDIFRTVILDNMPYNSQLLKQYGRDLKLKQ